MASAAGLQPVADQRFTHAGLVIYVDSGYHIMGM